MPTPTPKQLVTKAVNLRLSPNDYETVKQLAVKHGCTVSAMLRSLIPRKR